MMALMDKIQTTLTRLRAIREGQDGINEAIALEALRVKLSQLAMPIESLSSDSKLLRDKGVGLTSVSVITASIDSVTKLSLRFAENTKSATLTQGRGWTDMSTKLTVLTSTVEEVRNNDWKNFFEKSFFGGLPPTKREAILAPTPENKAALLQYKELYQKFIQYRSKIPEDAEEFETIGSLSKQLMKIKFQEDVPNDVRKFFEATNTGASLDLLTNEVILWLRNNDLLSRYVVKAKLIF